MKGTLLLPPFLIDIARGRLAQVDPALVLLQLSRSRGPKTTAVLASCSVRENPSDRSDQLRLLLITCITKEESCKLPNSKHYNFLF